MTAFAALTFVIFTCGFFLGAAALARWHADHPLVDFFTRPYARRGRLAWAVPHRFARKLWFALLVASWPFANPEPIVPLALLVFASLLVLLALALWLRPYADARDNQLEMACLLLLLYGYFASVLPESSVHASVLVFALQAVLLVYGAQRWLRQRLDSKPQGAASDDALEHRGSGDGDGGAGLTGSEADSAPELDDDGAPLAAGRSRPPSGPMGALYRGSVGSSGELAVPLMALGANGEHDERRARGSAADGQPGAV